MRCQHAFRPALGGPRRKLAAQTAHTRPPTRLRPPEYHSPNSILISRIADHVRSTEPHKPITIPLLVRHYCRRRRYEFRNSNDH